jgi:MATE family multidrug resistance protein
MTICFVPVALVILNSEQILLFIGQDPDVSHFAHKYNLVFLPAMYIQGLMDADRRFLNCMKKNYATLMIQTFGAISHIFWCYLFVDVFQMDIKGIGYACIVTNLGMYI